MRVTTFSRPQGTRGGFFAAALVVALAACAPAAEIDEVAVSSGGAQAVAPDAGLDNLNAVLWVQSAVEYRATCLQAFALARRVLDDALADPGWSAALEQTGDFADLPPAVVLDIDETVLDNSPFEARLTVDGEAYSDELWDAWVLEEAAMPLPGVRDFLAHAVERGVTIFYITNRRAHLEDATRANLEAEGLPLNDGVDTLLMRGELPEWDTSNKTSRRERVAADYRVLLMVGDNMGDFTGAASGSVAERQAFAEAHHDKWGTRWITLANPTHGSFIILWVTPSITATV